MGKKMYVATDFDLPVEFAHSSFIPAGDKPLRSMVSEDEGRKNAV